MKPFSALFSLSLAIIVACSPPASAGTHPAGTHPAGAHRQKGHHPAGTPLKSTVVGSRPTHSAEASGIGCARATAAADASLQQSRDYVNALVNQYRFKAGLTANEFLAFNPAVQPVLKGQKAKGEQGTTAYLLRRSIFKPSPLGPSTIIVDAAGKVKYFQVCFATFATWPEQRQAMRDFVADIRKNVATEYVQQHDMRKNLSSQELTDLEKSLKSMTPDQVVDWGFGPPSDAKIDVTVPGANAALVVEQFRGPMDNPVIYITFTNPE